MNIKAVLFDLDGTLADTALDLGGALNRLLRQKGLPEIPMEKIRPVASHGANGLIDLGAGIGLNHPQHAQWREAYLAEYEQCFTEKTVLFDGVNPLIAQLRERGLIWGIITNKPKTFTDRLLPCLNFFSQPATVISGDSTAEAKPSILPMQTACQEIGVLPEQCLYVGDAERDIQAGRNAGMKTVLARWGYISEQDDIDHWQADFMADDIGQVLDLLDQFADL